jgi:uncharacterized protein (UPF0303 family)
MTDLPVYRAADIDPAGLEVPSFDNDDAVALGIIAVDAIRASGRKLAVRVVLRGDVVFQAKLSGTGPGNDPWLAGKAAVVERFGEPSLRVRRSHEEAGTPFEDRDDIDHDVLKAHGGSLPIRVGGDVVGTITMSGEPDVIDHQVVTEAVRRYREHRA